MMNTRNLPTSKADLLYRRDRDAGRCTIGQFSPAHVVVIDPTGKLHVEILTDNTLPRWFSISPQMRPNEIEKAIRKSPEVSPVLKSTYLSIIDAGASTTAKEVRHG